MWIIGIWITIAVLFILLAFLEYCVVNKWDLVSNTNLGKKFDKVFCIKKVCVTGMMVALAWLFSIIHITIIPHILNFNLSFLPIVLVGFMYGPLFGYISGIVSNLLYSLIGLSSAFNPGLVLSSGIDGALAGLMILFSCWVYSNLTKSSLEKKSWLMSIIFLLIIEVVIGVIIYLNYDSLTKSIHVIAPKINSQLLIFLTFILGSLYTIAIIMLIALTLKKQLKYTTLTLIIGSQVIRIFLVGLILNTIWFKKQYNVDMTLIKVLTIPIDIFINVFLISAISLIIIKIDCDNYLYMLNNSQGSNLKFERS